MNQNDYEKKWMIRIQQTTSEGQTQGAPIIEHNETIRCLACGTRDLVLLNRTPGDLTITR